MSDTDTAPQPTLDGLGEPIPPGETPKQRRARKARERRAADKLAKASADTARTIVEGDPTPGAAAGRPKGSGTKVSKRAQNVASLVTLVGIGVLPFDTFDGTTIIEGAPDLGVALSAVADTNPKVARALDMSADLGAWAAVATAVAAIALPIVRHHTIDRQPAEVVEAAPATWPTATVVDPVPTVVADPASGMPVFRATHNDPQPADPLVFTVVQ